MTSDRLRVLRSTGVLDAPAQESFDRFTRLIQKTLHVPVSVVSLVDEDRQFFLSQVGVEEPWATLRETPLSHSFCKHVTASRLPLIVTDARTEEVLKSNPGIEALGMIGYAGIPLMVEEECIGALCAIDHEPHEWTDEELALLEDLAAAVSSELALRASLMRLESYNTTDALTGVFNRRGWTERLAHDLARARRTNSPLSVAMVGVGMNGFAVYSDPEGYAAGEQLLREFAALVPTLLREGDTFARWRNDEFAVALPDCGSVHDAETALARLLGAVPCRETFAVGYALWDGREDPEALTRRAELSLTDALASERPRVLLP
jgi:diguanylate cyclase (GGDEF)-like protein